MFDRRNYFYSLSVILLACLVISACNQEKIQLEDNTETMVALLDSIAKNVNPAYNGFANRARLEYYEKNPAPTETKMKIKYHYTYAQELLRAGDTKKAIDRFKRVLEMLKQLEPELKKKAVAFEESVEKYLALSYLRLGEQQNCLINHTSASCLFPIQGKGIHTRTKGSERAIELYQKILREQNSVDMISRWLLNIAYMTLGKHPEEVPEQRLIPPQVFESEYDIKPFPDIASTIGLAEMDLSGGSITEDFNNDGYLDIVASSWGLDDQLHYYENNGNGSFVKKTKEAGLTGIVSGLNIRHADFDNDGFADILVLRGAWLHAAGQHPNSLLHNNGDGTFSDVTKSAGLLSFHPTQTAEWGDFNNDGWLDLFIGNESGEFKTHPSELYINQQDGTFKNIAGQAGVNATGYIKGVAIGDFNNDGLQDLYISRLDSTNTLYKNEGYNKEGIPKFTDVTIKAGVGDPKVSFPTWFWDYNNDGWLDLFVAPYEATVGDLAKDYLGEKPDTEIPRLYKNNGDGTFDDVTKESRLNKVMSAMGSNFGDLDNDGYSDVYIGTGDTNFRSIMPNRMFRNKGGKFFQEVTSSGGFGHLQKGHGISFADLDNDGDQDIFTVISGSFDGDVYMKALFENPGHDNHWVTLVFKGYESNRQGIGNRIEINLETPHGSRTIHKVVGTGSSFGSNSLQQEVGLGNAIEIKSIKIRWPASGQKQIFKDVEMNNFYQISENSSQLKILERTTIYLGSENLTSNNH